MNDNLWKDAQEEFFMKHDLESIRFRCLVCNTRWYQCANCYSDITCPKCGPKKPPPPRKPVYLDDDILLDFWTGEPTVKDNPNV